MNKRLLSLSVLLFSIILSGCSLIELPNNLINKPSSYINKNRLDNIMSLLIKEGKTLTIALRDNNRKAIREVDLDKDGINELILLYKKDDNFYNNYGIIILKQTNDKWEVINNITFSCKNIDIVEYKDLTGDGKPEILVGVTSSDKNNNTLFIYSYHRGFYETLGNIPYKNLKSYDINNDKVDEIISLEETSTTKDKSFSSLKIYNFKKLKPEIIDSFDFTKSIVSTNLKIGKASKNINGIFVSINLDNKSFYTDLFTFEKNKLSEVLQNEKKKSNEEIKTFQDFRKLQKNMNLDEILKNTVSDINNDGILEIDVLKPIENSLKIYTPSNFNYWYQWNDTNKLNLVYREYNNAEYKYKISVPLSLGMNFNILQNVKEKNTLNRVDFFIDDYKDKNNLLFSIKVYPKNIWISNEKFNSYSEYVTLREDNDKVYIGVINQNKLKKGLITIDAVKNLFRPLEY